MAAIGGAILLTPVGCLAYAWYDLSQPPGVIRPSDWPPGLKMHHAEWKDEGVVVEGMEVYDASTFIDTEAYCRLPYSPKTWAYFRERYGSTGDVVSARRLWEGVRDELPDWAPNLDDPDVELLPIEPYGDGEHVRLAYDPGNRMIYISYVSIF